MLTQRHLALIRAALQFFDDEMVPHGRKAIGPYLDVPLQRKVTSAEIQELRTYLRNVDVKYGRYHAPARQMAVTRLSHSIAKTRSGDDDVTAIVLIPRKP